jgi:hypothetical protein
MREIMEKEEEEKRQKAEAKRIKDEKKIYDQLMTKIQNDKKEKKKRRKTANRNNIKNNRFICYTCDTEVKKKVSWASCVDCLNFICNECNIDKPKIFLCNECLLD